MFLHALLLPVFAAALSPTTVPEEFWLSPRPEAEEGTLSNKIDGVLLGREHGVLTIRVMGGTIRLPESAVAERVANGLTVAEIERREAVDAERLAAANEARRELLRVEAAEAEARRVRVKRAEAVFRKSERSRPQATPRSEQETRKVFDPVLGILVDQPVATAAPQRELPEQGRGWTVARRR